MSQREAEPPPRTDPDRLEELYDRAGSMDAEARERFLAEACGGDARLEGELRSLLEHRQAAEAFFGGLAETVPSPIAGHEIGQYRLIGVLGSGGMGTVYRAHDTRLDRPVALKFLPPYLSAQPEARERLLVEARAAAALEHPNLCRIHEIGATADGQPFIAMPCYEGETLKQRLARGPLPTAEALDIAVQLARGLAAAHARGIVHRDVKPGNTMLCADGTVRLLDFGLAKVSDVTLTGPGVTPGTVAYMSPEQARGDPVDHRTDLWSLGVVLYEMLSGARPFRGGSDRAVVQAIVHEEPAPLPPSVRRAAPSGWPIVARLLQKAREQRYQSADQLLTDLTAGTASGRPRGLAGWVRARRRAVALSGVGFLAAVGLLSLVPSARHPAAVAPSAGPTASPPDLAVLPFTVRGRGLEVWREGMVDLLSMGLDGAAGLRTLDSRTLLARWHQEIGDSAVADLALALGVARRSHARYALVGSAVAAGTRIRLSADLYDVESGRAVGPVQVDGPSDSVLAVVDRLGMQTLALMLPKDPGELPALDLAGITTKSLVALKAYLEGEDHYRRSEFREAGEAWERAARADTLFALAYNGLTDAYAWSDPVKYRENLTRSRRMAERLPPRERTVALAHWAQYTGAAEALSMVQEAIRKYPDDAEAWYVLGEVYYHNALPEGTPESAEKAFRRAAELQPTMAPYRVHLLDLAFEWRADSSAMATELEAYGRLAPEDPQTRAGRVGIAFAFGDSAARARAWVELGALDDESAFDLYVLLAHPRFAEVREEIYPILDRRLNPPWRGRLRESRFRTLALVDGRVREALAMLGDPELPMYVRYGGALFMSVRGLPVPDDLIARAFAAGLADPSLLSNRTATASVAAAAAKLGRWNDYASLDSRMHEVARRDRAAGDSLSAGFWDWAINVTEAHGLWRQGRKAEALRAFEHTLAGGPGWFTLWNVSQLWVEFGRLDQAEHGFRALRPQDGTPAYLELARLLERSGRSAEALQAYRFVAYAWRHADPELRPRVEEARRAVARLSAGGR